jgi:hypothetical protein
VTSNDGTEFLEVECGRLNVSAPDAKHAVTLSDCVSAKHFGAIIDVYGRSFEVDRLCLSSEGWSCGSVMYKLMLVLNHAPTPTALDGATPIATLTGKIHEWMKVSVAAYLEFASECEVSFHLPDHISCELIGPDDLCLRIQGHMH